MTAAALQRQHLDFKTWPDLLAHVDHLRQARYDRAGNWDLSQILEHVGEGLRTALRGSNHQGPWIVRKLFGPLILKRILTQRRMKAGIKVPKWWLPGPGHDESAAVDQFRAEVSAFEAMTTTPFPHPFFGPLSKQQWNDLVLIHAAHHLSFLIPRSK
ncbi:MAG TPA: DUF1569 domain-containing protein [Planctomycetaceae bacterium]|jgi:hypothetical protein|nr:DUF1569 domain-containing protein [Planctomycetaceae bacterium]